MDAGPGIDFAIEALGINLTEISDLFITHVHDDHFAGFTSLPRGERKMPVYLTPRIRLKRLLCFSGCLGRRYYFHQSVKRLCFI